MSSTFPLVDASSFPDEESREVAELCLAAWERHFADPERCARAIRENLARRAPAPWNVVMGTSYSFAAGHETDSCMHVYVAPGVGVLLWRP